MTRIEQNVEWRLRQNFEAGRRGSLAERATLVDIKKSIQRTKAAKAAKSRGKSGK